MGRTALAKVCDLVNVDRVVTDREPRPEIRRAMEAADVELIVAGRDDGGGERGVHVRADLVDG